MSETAESRANVYFLGIRTTASITRVLVPEWARALDSTCEFLPIDLPQHSPGDVYRQWVSDWRRDESFSGLQVTGHKVALFEAASDMIDELSPNALLLREVGGILRNRDTFLGDTPDVVALEHELPRILGKNGERFNGNVVILGGGGAALALCLVLAQGGVTDRRITITERDAERRSVVQQILRQPQLASLNVEVLDSSLNDACVRSSGEGALVVNATGMGKDLPGSPVGGDCTLPFASIAWDFNYRGELEFLKWARSQARHRGVVARDGWDFFLRNWYFFLASALGASVGDSMWERFRSVSDRAHKTFGATSSPSA